MIPPRRGMARASLVPARGTHALAQPSHVAPRRSPPPLDGMLSTEPLRQLLGLSGPSDTEPSVEHIVERIVDDLIDLALENARLTGELQRVRRDAEGHTSRGADPGSSEEGAVRDELRGARSDHEDLQLRPALSALEQTYIRSAMARTRGNQTAAARLLGLSRFGLQKKLRRLADGGDEHDDEPARSPR